MPLQILITFLIKRRIILAAFVVSSIYIFTEATMSDNKVDVLMVGTGEYTTGYVGGTKSDSDKGAGVVALTMFDLRRRGKVDRVAMCGVNVSNTNLEDIDCPFTLLGRGLEYQ